MEFTLFLISKKKEIQSQYPDKVRCKQFKNMKNKRNKGFSLIEVLIVVVVIGIIASIAIPNLIASRKVANEASAISAFRTISAAEITFYTSLKRETFGSLLELHNAGFIDDVIGCSSVDCIKSGYHFLLTNVDSVPEVSPSYYDLTATPSSFSVSWSGTGSRSFYTNEVGIIYNTFSAISPSGTDSINRKPTSGSPISQ
jgi:type IV pilus assembly protein PilA